MQPPKVDLSPIGSSNQAKLNTIFFSVIGNPPAALEEVFLRLPKKRGFFKFCVTKYVFVFSSVNVLNLCRQALTD